MSELLREIDGELRIGGHCIPVTIEAYGRFINVSFAGSREEPAEPSGHEVDSYKIEAPSDFEMLLGEILDNG